MARPWLLLACLLLASAAPRMARAQGCAAQQFANRAFAQCNALPVLGASLHWNYHAENGTADVAFRAPPQSAGGWVGWGLNPTGSGMPRGNVFIASQDASGAVSVLTTVLESTSPSLTNGSLTFDVPGGATAEFAGGVYTIYATLVLPGRATAHNTLWQSGPMSGGSISAHPISGANLQSTGRLDFASGQSAGGSNSRLHRRNIHGVLNAVSWGILLPLGVMMARYLRVFKSADPAWFYLHIACQCSGYILGVAGWGLGLKLGSESKGVTYSSHRNIGIALFCMATLQVFALLLRPDKKNKYRLYWNIYHHSVGYSVIILSIINIFKGFSILNPASGWKNLYIAIISVLGGVAVALEVITWVIFLRRRRREADKSHQGGTGANGGYGGAWQQQQTV